MYILLQLIFLLQAHCGVPGVGVGTSGTLTMIMGTSGCYMLNIDHDQITYDTLIKGCLGRVQDGILPTKLGLEMGQSAMGDLFAWLASITNTSVNELEKSAWAHVDYNSWKMPDIFSKIMLAGEIPEEEMKKTFNMGIGYCVVVPANVAEDVQLRIEGHGLKSWIIGDITAI